MDIARASRETADAWATLRAALWPEGSLEEHRRDVDRIMAQPEKFVTFLAFERGAAVGFAEGSLRFDYVNGCETSPVTFLEGIYVRSDHRRKGIARGLCAEVARWGREKGCTEMASDALVDNVASHAMHAALGFDETERVVCFRRVLNG